MFGHGGRGQGGGLRMGLRVETGGEIENDP